MKKLFTFCLALCATTALWADFTPAAFSVANGKQVYFSQGNLQCSGITTKNYVWSFAEHQYDMIGTANVSSSALADKIDLFGWSSDNTTAPWGISTSTTPTDYKGNFVDWGTNEIGDNVANTYRTLTHDEWNHLFNVRTNNASNLRGLARINLNSDGTEYANGLIFLPDNWTAPEGITFVGNNTTYANNTFTLDQWQQLETNGAIFLPASGIRSGTGMSDIQEIGYYWSATASSEKYSGFLKFLSNDWYVNSYGYVYKGYAVRLVQDVYAITITTPENGTITADMTTAAAGKTVTLTIEPATGYELETLTVKDANNNTITVTGNTFTMPAGAVTVTATFKKPDTKEYVDLGLPSGLLWATCNVGASAPEIYGNYYAWGETTTKETYTWDSYKYTSEPTKYNKSDELLTLEAEDDAAAVNWGGKWRMPTDAEMIELRTNCDWTWTTDYNGTGVAGCIVASKTNGNSIFLPAASYHDQNGIDQIGGNGAYWSSSRTDNVYQAHHTYFYYESGSAKIDDYTYYRNYGHSIRPVQEVVKYAVTVTTPENGTVTADMTTAAAGKTVTLTITPATGYELESISVKDADNVYPVSTDYKFTMPASEVTVSATFKKIDYAINIANNIENGKVSVTSGATTANYGDEVALTIEPAIGYELDKLTVEDANNNTITVTDNKFTMPASAVTVSATFNKIDYAINIANNIENGKVSVASGATTANYGDEVTLTITPDKGYELDVLYVKDAAGIDVMVSANNKFTMPASAVTVSATFKKIDYAINIANNIENGKVSVTSGATTANYGDEVTLTITPDKGYELDKLIVEDAADQEIPVTIDYKFEMPASEVTVTATFKKTVPTALQDAEMAEIYAENGTIYGAEGMQIFTITGQNVTEMNGQLNGVYIVKIGNAAQKIVVR